jgi:hypothetical protein
MPISESQLETWSHLGSVQQSKNTYQTVRAALDDSKATYAAKDYDIFLQGSYGNDTNIRGDSDVDTVIRLDSIMNSDVSDLPADQQALYHKAHSKATYTFSEFRTGVVNRLTDAFGAADVTPGNKAIKIRANGSRRSGDVVACYQHRRYVRYFGEDDQEFVEGVIFPTTSSGVVINYPKLHSDNLTAKHQASGQWLKPMVRIVKNMRSKLVEDRKIASDTAPSYYIEGMLWNVPKDKFGGSYEGTFINCINWLWATDRSKLLCAHEQHPLLGTSNVQWSPEKCESFLVAVINLWREY